MFKKPNVYYSRCKKAVIKLPATERNLDVVERVQEKLGVCNLVY